MAFAKILKTEFKDVLGRSCEISLLKDGYLGSATLVEGGDIPAELRYEGQGDDPYEALSGSSLTYRLAVKNSAVEAILNDIGDSPEDTYRLELYINSMLQWRGTVLNRFSTHPESSYPYVASITAVDGIARLKAIPWTLSDSRASMLSIIVECLNKLNYGLPFETADDFWSADMTQGLNNNPLALAEIDKGIFVDEKGNPLSYAEVLNQILSLKSLRLRQAQGTWFILQRQEYRKTAMNVRRYAADGTFMSAVQKDLSKVVDQSNIYLVAVGERTKSEAVRSISLSYAHRTIGDLVYNGSFELWDNPSQPPNGWTYIPTGGGITTRITTADVRHGDYALGIGSVPKDFGQSYSPTSLSYVESSETQVAVPQGASLRLNIRISNRWVFKPTTQIFDPQPRPMYFTCRLGAYYLQYDEDTDTSSWVQTSTPIYNKLSAAPTWSDHAILTPLLSASGNLQFRLTQGVDDRSVNGYSEVDHFEWDWLTVELLVDGKKDNITGRQFTVAVQNSKSTVDLTRPATQFGDGPSIANRGRITVGGVATTQWSRGGQTDNRTIHELNGFMQLRSLSTSCKIWRGTIRGDISVINSLQIHGDKYVCNGATWNVKRSEWAGEWQEILDNAPAIEYEQKQEQEQAVFSGGDNAAIFLSLLENARNLALVGGLTKTTANLAANVPITQIAVEAIPVSLKAGAKPVIVSRANARPFQVTLTSAASQGATVLNIASFTPDEPILKGSVVYASDTDILSYITQNENAINLRVQAAAVEFAITNTVINSTTVTLQSPYLKYRLYAGDTITFQDLSGNVITRTVAADASVGATQFSVTVPVTLSSGTRVIMTNFHPKRFMSELNIQWNGITADTRVLKSATWDGAIDGNGNITNIGTTGWALSSAGDIAGHNITARGTFKTSLGPKRVELRSSDNELQFFEGGVSKLRIGSNIAGGEAGISLHGIIELVADIADIPGIFAQVDRNGGLYFGDTSAIYAVVQNGISADGAVTIGVEAITIVAGGQGESYGIKASAQGAGVNWAGYFGAGNVKVQNALALGTASPSTPGSLNASGSGEFAGNLLVSGSAAFGGSIDSESRLWVANVKSVNSGAVRAINSTAENSPTASYSSVVVGYTASAKASGSQNFTNAVGLRAIQATFWHAGTGTVTGAAALYLSGANTGGGTITNAYGLYINDITQGVNNYAIYTNAGRVRFGGPIEIGNTVHNVSPTAPNRTVEIVINGVSYYLHAKTTND